MLASSGYRARREAIARHNRSSRDLKRGLAFTPVKFGVSFNGENGSGSVAYSGFAVVPAWNPAGFTRQTFNSIAGGMTTISDLAFNTATKRYVMTWFEFSSGALARKHDESPFCFI